MKQFQISNFKSHISKGFTLIELLVVIGILGVLAAALIATIDPFEQLRKANDTAARNTASEFLNAVTRYYGTKGAYPWSTTNEGGEACVTTYPSGGVTLETWKDNCIQKLVDQGELKSTFKNAGNVLGDVKVFQSGLSSTLLVCYQPQSKNGQKDPTTVYSTSTGQTRTSGCKSLGGTEDCLNCIQ